MAKHRLADREADALAWPAFAGPSHTEVAAHTDRSDKGTRTGMFRRKRHDDLFERSFRMCLRCGEHVYVLASSCRNCDADLGLAAAV